jgi:parvulin-like peptidyl-prolyl isomerase
MAMMAKMRSLAPAFILTVGAIFVLFMVMSDSNIMSALGGRSNNVGSVNGDNITYQEFSNALDRERQNRKSQSGRDVEDENTEQFRDQVWDAVVVQTLIQQEFNKFNIHVSDDEVRNIILSDNPPDFLKRNFIDSTGKFNKEAYQQAIFNPQNKEALINAEEYVRQNQLSQKLQSLVTASITISEDDIIRKFKDANTTIDSKYALVPINAYPDSILNISDDDLKDYYNKNLDKYRIEPQRQLKYVMFYDIPTKDDSLTIKSMAENIKDNFKSDTLTFANTAKIYTDEPVNKDTATLSSLSTEVAGELLKANPRSVVGPVLTSQGYVLINYITSVPTKKVLYRASHILINKMGSDQKNYEEAMKIYNELIHGSDFAKMAKENSSDPGSAVKGGDLGWFGKGMMVPEFEKAVINGKVGVVQKPIKSNFGYHIVKVTGKSDRNFVIEKLTLPIKASPTTKDALFNTAGDFAYLANQDGFDKAAESYNYKVLDTPPFVKDAPSITGIGINKRVAVFAFDNGVNSISPVYQTPRGYVVVQVSKIISEGIKPFDEVKKSIRPFVIQSKKFEKAQIEAEKIKKEINGDLDKAKSINSKVVVNETGSFKPTGNVPTVGRDFAFTENALRLKLNSISDPIKGIRGYYLIDVTSRTKFDTTTYNVQRNTLRDQILQEKKSTFLNQWLANLKKDADIVDHRDQFYSQQ